MSWSRGVCARILESIVRADTPLIIFVLSGSGSGDCDDSATEFGDVQRVGFPGQRHRTWQRQAIRNDGRWAGRVLEAQQQSGAAEEWPDRRVLQNEVIRVSVIRY